VPWEPRFSYMATSGERNGEAQFLELGRRHMGRESASDARQGDARPRVFFFARGRGHAHAIRAMEIAAEVEELGSNATLTFVSYGTGAETFKARGKEVVDLGIPETSPMWATLVRSGRLMSDARPDLVLSCEEFVVLPVARMMGIPAVFLGEWFTNPRLPLMQALAHADEIIFTEDPGIFQEPPYVKGKVFYSGPLVRKFNYTGRDRERARQELRLPADATVVAVLPGGGTTEENEPILHVLIPAFDSLRAPGKLMIWIAGRDYESLRKRFGERPDVVIKQNDWELDRLMVASDFAVTKGDRTTVKELAALETPSISISHGRSPVDDVYVRRIGSNRFLEASLLSPAELLVCMRDCLARAEASRRTPPSLPLYSGAGLAAAARRVAEHINRLEVAFRTAGQE
jgi:UDP-N-acetylglucosamine:LPS N-acetylglucosamine transferase